MPQRFLRTLKFILPILIISSGYPFTEQVNAEGNDSKLRFAISFPEDRSKQPLEGYNKIVQEYAYQFYQDWTVPDFPRMLLVKIQHANPYFDDSYGVNSANVGPCGAAITYELISHIEQKFRGLAAGWEPGGDDFFSPCLMEADLMWRVMAPTEFNTWLHKFLPNLRDEEPDKIEFTAYEAL